MPLVRPPSEGLRRPHLGLSAPHLPIPSSKAMTGVLNDLRFAVRRSRQSPLATLSATVTLAVGLAANLTIYSWLHALVYRPLSGVPDQSQIVVVDGVTRGGDDQRLSYPEFREIQRALPRGTAVLAYTYQPFALASGEHAERTWGQLVSANFFDVLEITPALGRAFRPEEEAEGAGPVAVISDAMWRRQFASEPRALGSTIQVNGQTLTVIGVAPPGFSGVVVGLMLDVWIPLGMQPLLSSGGPNRLAAADVRWLGAYGRVTPPTTITALTNGLSAAARELARAYPGSNEGVTFSTNSLADAPWGGTTIMRPVLTVLMVVVLVVLAATCVNVSLLLLAQAAVRRREMATRLALGAGRWRLVRQLALESLLLVVAAATAGVIASFGSARLFASLVPPTGFPIGFAFNVNPSLLALALALSSVAVVLFGLAPALHVASTRFASIFREESATVVGRGWSRVRTWLVAAQIAGGVALVSTSIAVSSGLTRLTQVDPGFETEHVLLAAVDLSQGSDDPTRGRQFIRAAIERLASVPGVRVATVARRIPLDFGGRGLVPVRIDGYTAAPGEDVSLAMNQVAPGYLDAMRIPLIAGRDLQWQDDETSQRVAIINRAAARRYWKTGDPVGTQIQIAGSAVRIVGVLDDFQQDQLAQPAFPAVLVPILQDYRPDFVFHLASTGEPGALADPLRRTVAGIDRALALYDVRTMAEHMQVPTFAYRLGSIVTAVFGAIALLLAALGLYAVVHQSLAERRAEIGLRVALGATRRDIVALVTRSVAPLLTTGAIAGTALGIVIARSARALLPGIEAAAPGGYLGAVVLTVIVTGLAAATPVWQAATETPTQALRR